MEIIDDTSTSLFSKLESCWHKVWWVILFALLCFFCYEQGQVKISADHDILYRKLSELKTEYSEALQLQEDLKLQINSQSDPEWIELTLIKELGLVPEGKRKIIFRVTHD